MRSHNSCATAEFRHEAWKYVENLTSIESIEPWLVWEIKHHRSEFVEAIITIAEHPNIDVMELSRKVGYEFDGVRMDLIADFYLRVDLNTLNKPKSGHSIQSRKQLARRVWREAAYMDELGYST